MTITTKQAIHGKIKGMSRLLDSIQESYINLDSGDEQYILEKLTDLQLGLSKIEYYLFNKKI